MNSKELQVAIDKIEEKLINPQTAQGDLKSLNYNLSNLRHEKRIAEREEYEFKNNLSVYGSDDYVGCNVGNLQFYFGYEVTKCPIKSHKTEEDCYDKGCDRREWMFQVTENDKVIFEMLDSELTYPESDYIERKLILGMGHYIKSINKTKSEET